MTTVCSPAEWPTDNNRPKIACRGAKIPTLAEVLDKYIKTKPLRPGAISFYDKAIGNPKSLKLAKNFREIFENY
jgi:hypothetical protein